MYKLYKMKFVWNGIYFVFIIFGLINSIKATTTDSMTTVTESMTTSVTQSTTTTTTTGNTVGTTSVNTDTTTTGDTVGMTTDNHLGSSTTTVDQTMAMENNISTTETATTDVSSTATMTGTVSPVTMMPAAPTAPTSTNSTMPSTTTSPSTTNPTTTQPTTTTTTQPSTTITTTPCPTVASVGATASQESDFGKVGFVAFGITFAIALILLVTLLIIFIRRKRKSGDYRTGEGSSPRLMMDGVHMQMPMNNDYGLDNVESIDLDKEDSERKVGNGTGLTSFKVDNLQKTPEEGATSTSKQGDSGSVKNLLNEEDYDKKNSDNKEDSDDDDEDDDGDEVDEVDGDDIESPATFIGLKVEPSTGASVESLKQLKETDTLMDNISEGTPSIDDHLPPPSLSESESESSKEGVAKSDEVTVM